MLYEEALLPGLLRDAFSWGFCLTSLLWGAGCPTLPGPSSKRLPGWGPSWVPVRCAQPWGEQQGAGCRVLASHSPTCRHAQTQGNVVSTTPRRAPPSLSVAGAPAPHGSLEPLPAEVGALITHVGRLRLDQSAGLRARAGWRLPGGTGSLGTCCRGDRPTSC